MTDKELMEKYPLDMILHFPPIKEIFVKHIPQLLTEDFVTNLPKEVTFSYLISKMEISEYVCDQILEEKNLFDKKFRLLQEQEAAEFGVSFDLDDMCHKWSNTDEKIQEACVSRIEEIYSGRKGEIIFYGPSNIQMWYSLEEDMLPYRAQNHGMGGCIDPEMIKYAPRMLYAFNPSIVFFQTGSNDLAMGISLEEIVERKRRMYTLFLENMPQAKLVIMSGLPLPGRMELWESTEIINAKLRELSDNTERLYFMDATDSFLHDNGNDEFELNGKYFLPEYYRRDMLHLNKKGHDIWTNAIKEFIKQIE